MQGEEIGAEGNDDEVRGDQGRPVDGSQAGPYIHKDDVGLRLLHANPDHLPERGDRAEGAVRRAAEAVRPLLGKQIFEVGKSKVAREEVQTIRHTAEQRPVDIADLGQRLDAPVDCRGAVRGSIPEVDQVIFVQESRRQIGLGVEVDGEDDMVQFGEHPRNMIDERGLPHSSLVVEERQGGSAHGRARRVQCSQLG